MVLAAKKFTDLADKLLNPVTGTFSQFLGDATFENAGVYNPVDEAVVGGEALTTKAVMLEFNKSQIDGQRIKQGDMQMIIQESLLGEFEINPDSTKMTFTGPKSTDVSTVFQVIAPTEYPVDSIIAYQVRL